MPWSIKLSSACTMQSIMDAIVQISENRHKPHYQGYMPAECYSTWNQPQSSDSPIWAISSKETHFKHVFRLLQLRSPFFWDITLQHWVIGTNISGWHSGLEMLGTNYPEMKCQIPEEQRPQTIFYIILIFMSRSAAWYLPFMQVNQNFVGILASWNLIPFNLSWFNHPKNLLYKLHIITLLFK